MIIAIVIVISVYLDFHKLTLVFLLIKLAIARANEDFSRDDCCIEFVLSGCHAAHLFMEKRQGTGPQRPWPRGFSP